MVLGGRFQISWHDDDRLLGLWRDAKTGFPWIDAAMIQVRPMQCCCPLFTLLHDRLLEHD